METEETGQPWSRPDVSEVLRQGEQLVCFVGVNFVNIWDDQGVRSLGLHRDDEQALLTVAFDRPTLALGCELHISGMYS